MKWFKSLCLVICFSAYTALPASQVEVTLQSSPDGTTWAEAVGGVVPLSAPVTHFRATVVPVDGGELTHSNAIEVDTTTNGQAAHVYLESSPDLAAWSPALAGISDLAGGKLFFKAGRNYFTDMISFQSGTIDVQGTSVGVTDDFRIGRFEVRTETWNAVKTYALNNSYTFDDPNSGLGCADNHPIHDVSWFDVIKWCNARSELEGLDPVYFEDAGFTTPYKSGIVVPSALFIDSSANGYRLPTLNEWRFAAAGGLATNGYLYSGSDDPDEVARYSGTSFGAECGGSYGTWPSGSLLPNESGLYDMSGNVAEWVWDGGSSDSARWHAGGTYLSLGSGIEILTFASTTATNRISNVGFRVVRNAETVAASASELEVSTTRTSPGKGKKLGHAK